MLRIIMTVAWTLALSATAEAAWIECDEMGGQLVDMPENAHRALVSINDEVYVVSEEEALVEGEITADEFCEKYDGEVAFVLPIPKPGIDESVPAVSDLRIADDAELDPHAGDRQRTHSVSIPERPRPDRDGVTPPGGDDEPAPLPAEIREIESPGPDVNFGCSAAGGRSDAPAPLALLLVFLGLRRREGGVR